VVFEKVIRGYFVKVRQMRIECGELERGLIKQRHCADGAGGTLSSGACEDITQSEAADAD
jgi:hypothetical protein